MLNIAILDDDAKMLSAIRHDVLKALRNTPAQIDLFQDGGALNQSRDVVEYDIYFLDIEVGQENGIEIGIKIRQTSAHSDIIFVTSHSEYALEGYDAFPTGYLIKPINKEKLEYLLKVIINKKRTPCVFIEITENHRKIMVSVDEIVSMRREKRKTEINLYSYEIYETSESLKNLMGRLPDNYRFFYIHRDTVIRIDHIAALGSRALEENTISMKNGSQLIASREGIRSLRKLIAAER